MKIIAIGGVPGTGKTLLVRKFMDSIEGEWKSCEPISLLSAMYNEQHNVYVLGKYKQGELFAGTDMLSMAVQPKAQEWISTCRSNVVFEGDRLFNKSFLEFLLTIPKVELFIIYLKVAQAILQNRYDQRGSNQSTKFIKGRETKYANLQVNIKLRKFNRVFLHGSSSDTEAIVESIGIFLGTGALPEIQSVGKPGIMKFLRR